MKCTAKFTYNGINYKFVHPSSQDKTYQVFHSVGEFYEREYLEYISSLEIYGTYIDVGANIGNHSVWFLNECHATKVVAIEMIPEQYKICIENMYANNTFDAEIDHYNFAVLDYARPVSHTKIIENCTGGVMVVEDVNGKIPGTTLDNLLYDSCPEIAFMKMDIEQYEPAALRGAKKILARGIPYVSVETLSRERTKELTDILDPLGYVKINEIGVCPAMLTFKRTI